MQSYLGRRPTAVHGHILHRSRDVSTESKKKQKRARKANFSGDEVDKLVGLVEVNYKTLVSKFCDTATLKSKNDTWAEITRKINAISTCLRTTEKVKKKWEDLKSKTKQKAAKVMAELGMTGNVPIDPAELPQLTKLERHIISLIGVEMVERTQPGPEVSLHHHIRLMDSSDL